MVSERAWCTTQSTCKWRTRNDCSKKNCATITKKNVTRSGTQRTTWLAKKAKPRWRDLRRWLSGGSRINILRNRSNAALTYFPMENSRTVWPLLGTKNKLTCRNHPSHGHWSPVANNPLVKGLLPHLHLGRMLAMLNWPAHNLETVSNAAPPQISIELHLPFLLPLPNGLRSEQADSKSLALSFQSECKGNCFNHYLITW